MRGGWRGADGEGGGGCWAGTGSLTADFPGLRGTDRLPSSLKPGAVGAPGQEGREGRGGGVHRSQAAAGRPVSQGRGGRLSEQQGRVPGAAHRDMTPHLHQGRHIPGAGGVGLIGVRTSQGPLSGAAASPAAGKRSVDSAETLPGAGRSSRPGVCGHNAREVGAGVTCGSALLGPRDGGWDSGDFSPAPRPEEPSSPTVLQKGTSEERSQGHRFGPEPVPKRLQTPHACSVSHTPGVSRKTARRRRSRGQRSCRATERGPPTVRAPAWLVAPALDTVWARAASHPHLSAGVSAAALTRLVGVTEEGRPPKTFGKGQGRGN